MNRREFLQLNGTVAGLACLPKLDENVGACARRPVVFYTRQGFVPVPGTLVATRDHAQVFRVTELLPTRTGPKADYDVQGAMVEAICPGEEYRTCEIRRVLLPDGQWAQRGGWPTATVANLDDAPPMLRIDGEEYYMFLTYEYNVHGVTIGPLPRDWSPT